MTFAIYLDIKHFSAIFGKTFLGRVTPLPAPRNDFQGRFTLPPARRKRFLGRLTLSPAPDNIFQKNPIMITISKK